MLASELACAAGVTAVAEASVDEVDETGATQRTTQITLSTTLRGRLSLPIIQSTIVS